MTATATDRSVLRVAVANDFDIVVAGIAAVLRAFPDDVEVVELDVRVPVVSEVDVVLYDSFGQVQGPGLDFDELVRSDTAKVVVFSWDTDDELVRRSLAAGADGYVPKAVTAEVLVDALRRVHAGERVTPRTLPAEGLPAEPPPELGAWPGADEGISARESEILSLICQGLSNEEISARAFLGINTIKTYIRSLYRKIGAESRTQAVLWGIDHGFRPVPRRALRDA